MSHFLTVKDAAQKTGKSPSSVRRLIYPILEDDQHPDRHHIEPNVATARELRLKGDNFAWKISEEFLARVIPETPEKSTGSTKSPESNRENTDAIVDILRKQLDIKDQQIAAQNEVIKGLSERVREGNILMGSLQQQLTPPKASEPIAAPVVTDTAMQGSTDQTQTGIIRRILHWKIF